MFRVVIDDVIDLYRALCHSRDVPRMAGIDVPKSFTYFDNFRSIIGAWIEVRLIAGINIHVVCEGDSYSRQH